MMRRRRRRRRWFGVGGCASDGARVRWGGEGRWLLGAKERGKRERELAF